MEMQLRIMEMAAVKLPPYFLFVKQNFSADGTAPQQQQMDGIPYLPFL